MAMVPDTEKHGPSVKGLERGLEVLDYLFTVPEAPLHRIAEKTDIPPSTVHRLLSAFESKGYVASYQGVYQLGIKGRWFTLVREPMRQILKEVTDTVGETANFAILVQNQMEFLERSVSDHPLAFVVAVGSRVPLHCSALGKAVLVHRPELLEGLDWDSHQLDSGRDPIEFHAELEVARQRGFTLDNQEFAEGVFCIAVPVFGRNRLAVGAVSISGPVVRFSRERALQIAPYLKQIGEKITQLLQ